MHLAIRTDVGVNHMNKVTILLGFCDREHVKQLDMFASFYMAAAACMRTCTKFLSHS
jgi:hypothetical protein